MKAGSPTSGRRVCSSCGEQPGPGLHCESCGTNLLWRRRLPTRDDWERRRNGNGEDARPAAAALQYSARDLGGKQRGQSRRLRKGKLMLVLTVNEMLERDEKVKAVFNAKDPSLLPCWLVLTSERLLSIPDRPAMAMRTDRREPKQYRLDELEGVGSRVRRIVAFRSRFYFTTVKDGNQQFSMLGAGDGKDLMKRVDKALAKRSAPSPVASGPPPAR